MRKLFWVNIAGVILQDIQLLCLHLAVKGLIKMQTHANRGGKGYDNMNVYT